MSILETQSLSIGYSGNIIQVDLNLSVDKGQVISILGPNGVGKTTFIKTITGIQPRESGEILINGRELKDHNARQLAKLVSVVLTEKPPAQNLTVFELVSMGRHPYSSWTGQLSDSDTDAVNAALEQTRVTDLTQNRLFELSDGQMQMVMIARALAQETDIIILDEPMAHLDLKNSLDIAQMIQEIGQTGRTVILSSHNWRLCTLISDQMWLFNLGAPVVTGKPEDLIVLGELHKTLGLKSDYDLITGTHFTLTENASFQIIGNDPQIIYWTGHALHKAGYNISDSGSEKIEASAFEWSYKEQTFFSIDALITFLQSL